MLRIQRSAGAAGVRLALSGRIEGVHLAELERAVADESAAACAITLDLDGVRLADREAIRFLARCEAHGMRLAHCPAYVREWIARERDAAR